MAAVTYLLLIIPIAISGLLSGRFNPTKNLLVLISLFLLGAGGVFITLNMPSPLLFMTFVVICGVAIGGTCCSGLKLLLLDATLRERAGLISALYLGAYIGSGIPNFSIGQLAKDVSMTTISGGFVVWITATWVTIVLTFVLIRGKPSEAEKKRFR